MNKLVSIIVPVYNVEKYIKKCIESLLEQTYKNIEIILIDDGSTDKSGKICDEYTKEYKNVSCYHKKNGGLSDARNYGIEKAKGKYITFFDSDDFASKEFIEALYDGVKKYDSDIVMSGLNSFSNYNNVKEFDYGVNNIIELSKEECYKKMLMQDQIDVNATAKLYKTEIFDNIRFPVGYYYEDIQIVDKVVESAKKISMITYKGYNYLQRNNSIMYGKMSLKRLSLIDKTSELIIFIEKQYPNIKKYAIHRYIYCNFHVLGRSILDDNYIETSKKLRNNILNYKDEINKSSLYSKKEKIALKILQTGLKNYKFFWKLYCKIKRK